MITISIRPHLRCQFGSQSPKTPELPYTSYAYDPSAAIWTQNTMRARPNARKPYDANLGKSTIRKKCVTPPSPRRQVCAAFAFFREAAHVAGVHFKKSMWCLRYETGEMTGRDHYHCLLSVGSPPTNPHVPFRLLLGSEWVGIATCFYLMDFWEKKLRCGHARVRVFAPALGGAAYTCKDLAESLAGKDRYEFEKFFAPRTVLTLSESVFRFIDTRQRIPV